MCGNCGRREETDMERDMVNDGSDTKYQSCSELRLDGGVGSLKGGEHSLSDWPGRLGDLISVHM